MDHVGRTPLAYSLRTCFGLLVVLIALPIPTILSLPLLIPDPSTFPGKLREFYTTLDEQFHCDFNRADLCSLRPEPTTSWSFAQSFRELAEQFSRAAEAAAAAAASSAGDSVGIDGRSMVPSPVVVNHFACAVPPKFPNETLASPYLYSTMDWSIPWPRFSSFTVPTDRDAERQRNSSVSDHLLGVSSQPEEERSTSEPRQSPPLLLACVQVRLRFPPNYSSQIQLSFSSLLQQIDLPPENHTPISPPPPPHPPGIRRSLRPIRQSLGAQVPRSVWTELTVPILDIQADNWQQVLSPNFQNHRVNLSLANGTYAPINNGEPMTVFAAQQRTWVVRSIPTVLRLRTTPHVCVDDFRFRVWAHRLPDADSGTPSTDCVRSLVWQDPVARQKRSLFFVDERGTILETNGAATGHRGNTANKLNKNEGILQFRDQQLDRGLDWLPFASSLVLAVASTILFLLLVAAICGSVTLAQRRRFRVLRDSTPKRPSPVDRSPPRPYRPSRFTRSASSDKFEPEQELMFGEDAETGSARGGDESLFQQSTSGTYHSGSQLENPNEPAVLDSGDVTNMSAVQLMRNWYFYRRRGHRRARHQQGLHPRRAPPSTSTVSSSPQPVAVRQLRPSNSKAASPLARLSLCVQADGHILPVPVDRLPLDSITETLAGPTTWESQRSGSHTPSTLPRSQLSGHSNTDSA